MKNSQAELLAEIQKDLQAYKVPLGAAADTIVNEGVSKYPIFVVHQQEIAIGIPIVKKDSAGVKWSINASTLEEFSTKKLIEQDKIQEFRKVYKPVNEQICLFILSELGATFVFLPRI